MPTYVYIIRSLIDGVLYKGISKNPHQRLVEHNLGQSTYTSAKKPWELVFLRKFDSNSEALSEEKRLKRSNKKYLVWYIQQPFNELQKSH